MPVVVVALVGACTTGSSSTTGEAPTSTRTNTVPTTTQPPTTTGLTTTTTSLPTTTTVGLSRSSIEGVWVLESFEVDGIDQVVEVGVNTASMPWIEITTSALGGSGGCNSFGRSYTLSGGLLVPGEGYTTAVGCVGSRDVMAAENAFFGLLSSSEGGVRVVAADGVMEWSAGDTRLVFSSVEALPLVLP